MSYDEKLAERVRRVLARRRGVVEKKMFGGLAFLLHGRMCCGVLRDDLVVRVGPERYEEALARPQARPMDFTGRPLAGYVYVAPAGCKSDKSLERWVHWGADFASTLPAKKSARRKGAGGRLAS